MLTILYFTLSIEEIVFLVYFELITFSSLEKHYGCYRVGALISLIIIFVLILGCVPVFIGSEDSKLILTVLIICMVVAGLLTFAYFEFMRRRAVHMRQNSVRGAYSTIERRSKEEQVCCYFR